MGQESVIRDLDSGRAVAVIALDEGRVALLGHGGAPGLPVSPGSGEQAVRHGLAEWLGSKVADVVLLGRTPPTLEQPSLEVWLARRLRRGQSPPGAPAVEWMPMRELARAVRTSTMRDPATLAAFAVAARSRLLPEWSLATDPAQATPASARGTAPDLLDPTRSLVEFNVRVLAVAEDVRTPLLERLRYLAIVSANLDELYMASGGDVDEARVGELLARMQACIGDCLARLAEQGYPVRSWDHLTPEEREALKVRFRRELFPLLTPRGHHPESRPPVSGHPRAHAFGGRGAAGRAHRSDPLRLPPPAVRPAPLRRVAGRRRARAGRTGRARQPRDAVSRPHHRGGRDCSG